MQSKPRTVVLLEAVVAVNVSWYEHEHAAGRHGEIEEAASGFAVEGCRQGRAVRLKEIQSKGHLIGGRIGDNDLCCPSSVRGELRKKLSARAADSLGYYRNRTRCPVVGDSHRAEHRTAESNTENGYRNA